MRDNLFGFGPVGLFRLFLRMCQFLLGILYGFL